MDFFSSLSVRNNSEAHSASYPMGNGGPSPAGKAWSGSDVYHLPPSSDKVKNE
jgi:hypothetical protein